MLFSPRVSLVTKCRDSFQFSVTSVSACFQVGSSVLKVDPQPGATRVPSELQGRHGTTLRIRFFTADFRRLNRGPGQESAEGIMRRSGGRVAAAQWAERELGTHERPSADLPTTMRDRSERCQADCCGLSCCCGLTNLSHNVKS